MKTDFQFPDWDAEHENFEFDFEMNPKLQNKLALLHLRRKGEVCWQPRKSPPLLDHQITPQIFSECVFYPGAGLDIEPLLRLSNLATTFLFVSLHISKETVFDFLRDMLGHHPQLQLLSFEDHPFDECRDFALHPDYRAHLNEGRCFMDEHQLDHYHGAFTSTRKQPQWLIHATVLRRDTRQLLTLYYASAEGLATYLLLSHRGRFTPRVLITIETKVLEDPGNPIIPRLFSYLGSHPPYWVRGFQGKNDDAPWDPFSQEQGARVLSPDPLYTHIALDFAFHWEARGDFQSWGVFNDLDRNTTRYCKMFTTTDTAEALTARPFRDFGRHRVEMGDLFEVAKRDGSDGDWLIAPARVLAAASAPAGLIPFTWEDIMQARPLLLKTEEPFPLHMAHALCTLERALLSASDEGRLPQRVFLVPWGLEDQGCQLARFLEHCQLTDLHIVARRPADLVDLRLPECRDDFSNPPNSTTKEETMPQAPIITIRSITSEDHAFIVEQADQFTVFGPYVNVFRKMLNGIHTPGVVVQNIQFFICEANGNPAGFLAVEWKTVEGLIHGVVTAPNFKRQGVGSSLINHVVAEARARGIATLKAITAETDNPAALALFNAHGLENQGRAGSYPNGQGAAHLVRELSQQ